MVEQLQEAGRPRPLLVKLRRHPAIILPTASSVFVEEKRKHGRPRRRTAGVFFFQLTLFRHHFLALDG